MSVLVDEGSGAHHLVGTLGSVGRIISLRNGFYSFISEGFHNLEKNLRMRPRPENKISRFCLNIPWFLETVNRSLQLNEDFSESPRFFSDKKAKFLLSY